MYSEIEIDQTFLTRIPDLDTKLDIYRLTRVFSGSVVTGVATQQEKSTLPATSFLPVLGLAYALIIETKFFKKPAEIFRTLHIVLSRFYYASLGFVLVNQYNTIR